MWGEQRYLEKNFVRPNEPGYEGSKNFASNSFSGNERNRLFLQSGDNFSDLTLVSGVDDRADGRSFALLDFNNDGWVDIAMMGLNQPRFKLYQNNFAQRSPDNQSIRIKLVGSQSGAKSSATASNRDAVGAKALVIFKSGKKVLLQQQFGEGFATQNSKTLFLGCPKGDSVESIQVSWPSGKASTIEKPDITNPLTLIEPEDELTQN